MNVGPGRGRGKGGKSARVWELKKPFFSTLALVFFYTRKDTASEPKMSESIYKFVEQPKQEEPKGEIYRSKYDPKGPLIGSTFCMQGTTAVDGKGFHSLKKVGVSESLFQSSLFMITHFTHNFAIASRTTS